MVLDFNWSILDLYVSSTRCRLNYFFMVFSLNRPTFITWLSSTLVYIYQYWLLSQFFMEIVLLTHISLYWYLIQLLLKTNFEIQWMILCWFLHSDQWFSWWVFIEEQPMIKKFYWKSIGLIWKFKAKFKICCLSM